MFLQSKQYWTLKQDPVQCKRASGAQSHVPQVDGTVKVIPLLCDKHNTASLLCNTVCALH